MNRLTSYFDRLWTMPMGPNFILNKMSYRLKPAKNKMRWSSTFIGRFTASIKIEFGHMAPVPSYCDYFLASKSLRSCEVSWPTYFEQSWPTNKRRIWLKNWTVNLSYLLYWLCLEYVFSSIILVCISRSNLGSPNFQHMGVVVFVSWAKSQRKWNFKLRFKLLERIAEVMRPLILDTWFWCWRILFISSWRVSRT